MLKITNLTASIGDKKILNGVDLNLNYGEVLLVTGHNGSGKSTLLHTIMGRPDIRTEGSSIVLDGEDILVLECHERAKKGVFMFHQTPPTIDGVNTMSLLSEINNTSDIKLTKRALIDEAKDKFQALGLPEDWSKRQFNLGASGGERKKNEIAQAELFGGRLLLLDEPDSGLEQASRQRIIDLIEKTKRAGGIVILVTHDRDLQDLFSGNKIELGNGRII
jgi:Fe-S cluster assembly ATP-binding protein